jgi:tetratricopeptide (TPR) repeat protein
MFAMFGIIGFYFIGCSQIEEKGDRFISDTDTTYSEDVRSISKRINDDPLDDKLYVRRANTFYFEDRYKDAVLDIDYAIGLAPKNAIYYFKKGEYLMKQDTVKFKEVRSAFEGALKIQPEFSDASLNLAKILIARQEYQKAEKHISDILYQDKTNAEAYFYRGISRKEQKDTINAVDMFTQALLYNDDYLEACIQLGDLYAARNNKLALQYFDKALQIDEYSYEALYSKGLYLQKNQQYKDALIHYERVVDINTGHKLAYYNMAYINLLFENFSSAMAYADDVIEIDPTYDNAYYLKGLCLDIQDDKAGAVALYEKTLEVNPENPLAKKALGK